MTLLQGKQLNAFDKAVELIKKHEGYSRYLYYDANGYSIGYGTNLNDGISKEEALFLLKFRLRKIESKLKRHTWYNKLSVSRKIVLLDMAYNLGLPKLYKFKDFIWCLKHGYYHGASNRMKKSLWYKQTKNRAEYLIKLMYYGD